MPGVLSDPREASPTWLTDALHAAGALGRGRVTGVRAGTSESASTWMLHHLALEYSADAGPPARPTGEPPAPDAAVGLGGPPTRLLLKISHNAGLDPAAAPHHGLSTGKEVWFYRHVAAAEAMASVPLVRCYTAAHDPQYGASYALVDDLSATHGQPPLLLPPGGPRCAEAIEGLAQLHAAWWEHPRLGPGGDIAARLAWERTAWSAIGREAPPTVVPLFLDYAGDRLSPEHHAIYRSLLETEPRRRAHQQRPPQTLRHGDAHWWNFLYPNDPAAGVTRLLDWGSWRIGAPTDDVAYMVALHGSRSWRRRFERDLLSRYHAALVQAGVRGYAWQTCWDDYRRSVLESLLVAPHFWSIGVPAFIWWPKLECGLAAFEDHRCAELLDAQGRPTRPPDSPRKPRPSGRRPAGP